MSGQMGRSAADVSPVAMSVLLPGGTDVLLVRAEVRAVRGQASDCGRNDVNTRSDRTRRKKNL